MLSLFKTSLFFIVNVLDVNDDVFDTADSDDGDYDDKKSVDNQADTINAVDGDESNTGDITTSNVVLFFQPMKATYHSFSSLEYRTLFCWFLPWFHQGMNVGR